MNNRRLENQCKGKTKQGRPCRAAATDGGLCFFHANPNKAAELGRVGGRKNRGLLGSMAEPPRDLKSIQGVRDAIDQLVADVYSGKVTPRIAGCVATLLHLQMRAIQATDLEMRIARLEQSREENRNATNLAENQAAGTTDSADVADIGGI